MPRKSISFDLDFVFKDIFPRFTVKQFDDVTFNIKPKLQGSDYDITGMTGKIFVGVNNDVFMQTQGITVTSNNIDIVLDKNMLQKNGRAYAEIELTDSNGTITSSSFIFNIDAKVGEGGQIPGGIEGFVQKYERLISEFKSQVNSSINSCNDNVANKLNSVDAFVNTKISDFENRFNTLTASKQQDAEVIDARGGENSLKARLDKINSQLEHNKNNIKNISVLLTDYSYLVVDGDWSEALKMSIMDVQDGGTVKIPSGVYNVSTFCDFEKDWTVRLDSKTFTIVGDGSSSILKGITGSDYVLKINRPISRKCMLGEGNHPFNSKHIVIKDLAIDCNGIAKGIFLQSCGSIKIYNVNISNQGENDDNDGGIIINGAGMFRFKDIYSATTKNGIAININTDAGDGSISGCDISSGRIGILLKDCTGDIRIYDNTIYNQSESCIKTTGDLKDNNQIFISKNHLAQARKSLLSLQEGCLKTGVTSFFINDNLLWMDKNLGDGLVASKLQHGTISNNVFMDINGGIGEGKTGILINSSKSLIIQSNIFKIIQSGGTGIKLIGTSKIVLNKNLCDEIANSNDTVFMCISGGDRTVISENQSFPFDSKHYNLKIENSPSALRSVGNIFHSGLETEYNELHKKTNEFNGYYNKDGFKLMHSTYNINPLILNDKYVWFNEGNLMYKAGIPETIDDGELVLKGSMKDNGVARAGEDFNTLTTSGYYYIQNVTTNKPNDCSSYGLLEVITRSEYVKQIYYPNDNSSPKGRFSTTYGNAWTSWS